MRTPAAAGDTPTKPPARLRRLRGGAVVVGLLLSGGVVWQSSHAAFTATAVNPDNAWQAGTVILSDNPGTAVFSSGTKIKPDDPKSQCIDVTYGGNLATAGVRFYLANKSEVDGAADGAVLDDQLKLFIQIGDADDTCATLVPTWTTLGVATPGTVISTLATSYTGWGAALATGWSPAPAESRAFKFTSELDDNVNINLSQGDSVEIDFVWETQNS